MNEGQLGVAAYNTTPPQQQEQQVDELKNNMPTAPGTSSRQWTRWPALFQQVARVLEGRIR